MRFNFFFSFLLDFAQCLKSKRILFSCSYFCDAALFMCLDDSDEQARRCKYCRYKRTKPSSVRIEHQQQRIASNTRTPRLRRIKKTRHQQQQQQQKKKLYYFNCVKLTLCRGQCQRNIMISKKSATNSFHTHFGERKKNYCKLLVG